VIAAGRIICLSTAGAVVGPQVALPAVIAGFEIRGLDTYTWQATFFSTNIYSDVSRAASSFANSVIGILNPMSYL
jgi:hypothetical protein